MRPQPPIAPQPPPQQQKSWFARNWGWLLAAALILPMLCCVGSLAVLTLFGDNVRALAEDLPQDRARVDCGKPGPGGVDCVLKRTEGTSSLQLCWDLNITCQNQGVMTGHACADLPEGEAEATSNMPVDGFSNQEGCDVPQSGLVENLVVKVR